MELTDFCKGTVWGIHQPHLDEITARLPDLKTASDLAIRFTETPEDRDDFMLRQGVAIIPVTGPMSKRGSLWSLLFGGTPLNVLTSIFTAAVEDLDVEAIVLDIDSPGGTVSGTEAFCDLVYEARAQKPVVAFANGMMASSAYWIGSGAKKVVAERSALVGSIGVVAVHYDVSNRDERHGEKRTIIAAGKYKAIDADNKPLSNDGREYIQERVDYLYSLFVNTVARNRNTDAQTVLENMADGRIFIGQQAVDAGLADEVGSLETALATARSLVPEDRTSFNFLNFNQTGAAAPPQTKETIMPTETVAITTVEQMSAAYPELAEQLRQQGAAGVDRDAISSEAAGAEQERILGLAAIQFGAEAGEKFTKLVNAGVTVEQFEAIHGASATTQSEGDGDENQMTQKMDQVLAAIQNTGAENPGAGHESGAEETDFMALVENYATTNKVSKTEAMRAISASHPELHEKYLEGLKPVGSA